MPIPKPVTRVRGSQTGSPIKALLDLLGRRWALGILWNLGEDPATFRDLQRRCGGISPSILNSRLKDLKDADMVGREEEGYTLTERGKELYAIVLPLGAWSASRSEEAFGHAKPGMRESVLEKAEALRRRRA
ncbi:MAG: helix-turn-helix transcriptional regulator [Spirochaetes bacterium]|nr:helix-turn-helix transcriptional regulator [Spirochaetota bacterium]MBU1080095.1 helix-turn-helix transcriptional regulator [Spirochaetota bacterium]